jgi:SAM-dependent methyltransferase
MDERLYDEFAEWWPLLSAPEDYQTEAAIYRGLVEAASTEPIVEVLELGSGGGNNASHLKAGWRLTLVDRSPRMLEVSRRRNPELEHVVGDMREVRLGRTFDAVFVHDAVSYLTSAEDLAAAFATTAAHLRPGGVALFTPDFVRETFFEETSNGGHDGTDRGMRYLEWRSDPDPSDDTYVMDFAYLFRLPDGSLRAEADRHVCGLFARATWLELLDAAGFDAWNETLLHGETVGTEGFVGRRR